MLSCQFILLVTLSLVFGREARRNNENTVPNHYEQSASWEAPIEFQNKFPHYLSGYDYENRPVVVVEHGRWYTRSIAEKGGEGLATLKKLTDQFVARVKTGFYCKKLNITDNCRSSEIVVIFDYDGMDLEQYRSAGNIQYLISLYPKLDRAYDQFEYGFMVNVNPLAEKLLQLVKPLAGKFLERMEIHGTNKRKWMPRILRKIPRDQLPEAYGGNKTFKPVEFYG